MFSSEVRQLLAEVISSWQVLTVTVVLIIYMFLVNYVARVNRSSPRRMSPAKAKRAAPAAPAPSESDELDLEEADSEE